MAAGRTVRSLVGRRRRVGDEGEEDEGPVIVDDSQSEGSILSDMDDDDTSSLAEVGAEANANGGEVKPEGASSYGAKPTKKARKPRKKSKKAAVPAPETETAVPAQTSFKAMADTEIMMNGLRINQDGPAQEAIDFEPGAEAAPTTSVPAPTNGYPETLGQRQRREHEEYRRKRDADPAFVPNRGNFFMHDTRGQQNGQGPPIIRGGFAGRGRGRGGPVVGGPFSPANQMAQAERSAEQPWKHDLHETINEETMAPASQPPVSRQQQEQDDSARLFPKPAVPQGQAQPRTINFSSTTLVGKVQIRVVLPGMKAPVIFSEVPWKYYVRLPNHRPPLRRDKPVRVSLPDRPPHYIFPSTDRSFVFIPRQQRPSQHGYHRGSYQRSVGGYGGYSSRRTSVYGGSVYASSIAASRRSSMAGISRADAFSPTSFTGMPPPNRPVVRLPHGGQPYSGMTTPNGPLSGQHTPSGMLQIHTYPLPQQPIHQGTPTSTMHQPRPQKAISVTGIESPALLQQVPSNEPQPFESQLPPHMSQAPAFAQPPPQQPYFSPRQQYAYPQQPQAGTPLSGIPEQAMHAQPFQPPMPYGQSPFYAPQVYPPQPQQQHYYYSPPTAPDAYAPMPMYMSGPPQSYPMMPPPAQHLPPPQPELPASEQQESQQGGGQSGMMAHESNGMVFYVPRSEVQEQDAGQQNYQPAESFVPSYAMPGLPPPTPAPEASAGYYYPAPQMQGVQGMGQGPMYYSTAGGQQTG